MPVGLMMRNVVVSSHNVLVNGIGCGTSDDVAYGTVLMASANGHGLIGAYETMNCTIYFLFRLVCPKNRLQTQYKVTNSSKCATT